MMRVCGVPQKRANGWVVHSGEGTAEEVSKCLWCGDLIAPYVAAEGAAKNRFNVRSGRRQTHRKQKKCVEPTSDTYAEAPPAKRPSPPREGGGQVGPNDCVLGAESPSTSGTYAEAPPANRVKTGTRKRVSQEAPGWDSLPASVPAPSGTLLQPNLDPGARAQLWLIEQGTSDERTLKQAKKLMKLAIARE